MPDPSTDSPPTPRCWDDAARPIPSRALILRHERMLPTSLGLMAGEVEVVRAYVDRNDWWVGYYRGDDWHYVCLIPTIVLRFPRRQRGV